MMVLLGPDGASDSGGGSRQFTCYKCNKKYNRISTLRNHLRYECGKEPKFKCMYCDYRSKRKGNVVSHIRTVHKNFFLFINPDPANLPKHNLVDQFSESINQMVLLNT
uniref:Longitudinals lacking protein, isoforms A/B/D/L n=2 Tax=Cacopsylla melanoneura TaxID=428564 RepID=A0A8D9EW19_9HEMI